MIEQERLDEMEKLVIEMEMLVDAHDCQLLAIWPVEGRCNQCQQTLHHITGIRMVISQGT